MFVASLSEFDQVLYEDETKNRLDEALELFAQISNSKWFVNAALILFLNKKDLFEKKVLRRTPTPHRTTRSKCMRMCTCMSMPMGGVGCRHRPCSRSPCHCS